MPKVNPARSPPVRSVQLLATSWVKNNRARVMTVAATDPERAPERPRPIPTTAATTSVAASDTTVAVSGLKLTSTSPKGASGMRVALASGPMAKIAKM